MTLDLDPDRKLALAYVPARHRAALEVLWRLDVALASILASGRDLMVSRIRLAWWREALETLDVSPPPPEPLLRSIAHHLLPTGMSGAELAEMEPGWAVLASDAPPSGPDLDLFARRRGGLLFVYSARLLGCSDTAVEPAGEVWALVDLARRSASRDEAKAATASALQRELPLRWPMPLRPLGMLAILARDDARRDDGFRRRHGSPGRMARMMAHALTGR